MTGYTPVAATQESPLTQQLPGGRVALEEAAIDFGHAPVFADRGGGVDAPTASVSSWISPPTTPNNQPGSRKGGDEHEKSASLSSRDLSC